MIRRLEADAAAGRNAALMLGGYATSPEEFIARARKQLLEVSVPHLELDVRQLEAARIAAVEGKLGGVDAAAARRPLIEDRFVF